ncbi:speckle-type POZ protein-like [Copidosoma floridanum]|uniref:speckle-type POZ protein-like n=1 Tax=Copidosoma floridanum TaxID=29053 RepID=UPI000C6FC65A|nr:speckle-type POZ protein-like [Copidosoma floridanum]
MCEILNYIYSGKVENLESNTLELLAAANRFDLNGLKLMCENNFLHGLNISNASSLLLTADDHDASTLKIKVMEYIALNVAQVTETAGYKKLKATRPDLIVEIFSSMKKFPRLSNSGAFEEAGMIPYFPDSGDCLVVKLPVLKDFSFDFTKNISQYVWFTNVTGVLGSPMIYFYNPEHSELGKDSMRFCFQKA